GRGIARGAEELIGKDGRRRRVLTESTLEVGHDAGSKHCGVGGVIEQLRRDTTGQFRIQKTATSRSAEHDRHRASRGDQTTGPGLSDQISHDAHFPFQNESRTVARKLVYCGQASWLNAMNRSPVFRRTSGST